MWKVATKSWDLIGEVTGENKTEKKFWAGDAFFPKGDYDYIFDVQDEEVIMRKFPYQEGDRPWEVAEKFLKREEMGKSYLEQIVRHIKKNTRGGGKPIEKPKEKN